MGDEERDKWGQLFSLLLVGGLVGVVAWFAKGFGPADAGDGGVGDASIMDGAASADAAVGPLDGESSDAGSGADPAFEPSGLHTAIFGAVVTESGGATEDEESPFDLAVGEGCVLIGSLGPELQLRRLRLSCATLAYDSGPLEGARSTVTESLRDGRPVHTLGYTTPTSVSGLRVSVDTTRETLTVLGPSAAGHATARLRVERISAARPGPPLSAAPAPLDPPETDVATLPAATCPDDAAFTGAVFTAADAFEPLTLRRDDQGPRLDLFGAPVEPARDVKIDCDAGTARIEGPDSLFEGALGPDGRTIIGHAEVAGEAALFWLRVVP